MGDVFRPPQYSLHHQSFEWATADGDESGVRTYSLGGQLEMVRLQMEVRATHHSPAELVKLYHDNYRKDLTEYVTEQVTALQEASKATPIPHQNPRLYLALADQLVLLPVLFDYYGEAAREQRRTLISSDGIYGTIAEALDDEIRTVLAPEELERRERRAGTLTELTALALLNRFQLPDEAALPTLPYDDEWKKRDIDYHYRTQEHYVRWPQVKNNELDHPNYRGQLIGGIALGNSPQSTCWRIPGYYQTAKAIVREVDGVATRDESHILDIITTDLISATRAGHTYAANTLSNVA